LQISEIVDGVYNSKNVDMLLTSDERLYAVSESIKTKWSLSRPILTNDTMHNTKTHTY